MTDQVSDLEREAEAAADLAEARGLVRRLFHHIDQMPFDLGDIDPELDYGHLPAWVRGGDEAARETEVIVEWAVYAGGFEEDCDGPWTFSDEDEAREIASHLMVGGVTCRALIAGPWVAQPNPVPSETDGDTR